MVEYTVTMSATPYLYIHADRKQTLMRELDSVGINEKTLFPGLDGIGRYVEQRFRFNYNEAMQCL